MPALARNFRQMMLLLFALRSGYRMQTLESEQAVFV